jgi:hypothetical protein
MAMWIDAVFWYAIGSSTTFLVIYAGHRWQERKRYWEEIENDKIRKGIK